MRLTLPATEVTLELSRVLRVYIRILDWIGGWVRVAGLLWVEVVALWALSIYLIIQIILPRLVSGDAYLYVWQPVLWISLAGVAGLGWRYGLRKRPSLRKVLLCMALLTGILQISLLVIAGLIQGFGRSPYSHQFPALLGNLLYIGSMLVGIELSRAYLMGALGRRLPLPTLIMVSLLFWLLTTPLGALFKLQSPREAIQVAGELLLPNLAENLLATFLALTGGPLASILYRGTLLGFEWLSPILPDLSWFTTALLGTLVPAGGLLVIHDQLYAASASQKSARLQTGQSSTAWVIVALIALALIGLNTGLFGVQPTLIASNSMSPKFWVGDVVITQPVKPAEVAVGDIIRYRDGRSSIVHRVVDIQQVGNQTVFITRGDRNDSDDPPVSEKALQGEVVFTVPKIGWVAIGIRELLAWIMA